jgi:proteic killer suppression protein
MIKSFADKDTEELYRTGKSSKVPADVRPRALRKLTLVDTAVVIDDLKVPPGNRLHRLRGERSGQYSISVNDQWRICFRFAEGNAYDVEFCDYH